MRKLATIEQVVKIQPALNSDNLQIVHIKGWQVITKINEFKLGDLCVYVEIDSILPDKPEFEFMRQRKFHVKTIKLRGNISQGIVFPMSILKNMSSAYEIGQDVTEELNITKRETEIPIYLSGEVKGKFPTFLHRTDSERIQNIPEVLELYKDTNFYISEKLDGTSFTCYNYNGNFGVCSRNIELRETKENTYWAISRLLGLEIKLSNKNLALQGELIGPGIQKNKYKLSKLELRLFRIYDIDNGKLFTLTEFTDFVYNNNLLSVPILGTGKLSDLMIDSVEMCVALSAGQSMLNNIQREGLVFCAVNNPLLNFKVINPEFLLTHGE